MPLLIRWPGHIPPGGHTAALAQLFNVYPTIVEAVGGKLSTGHFARSLLPVAAGKARTVRSAVFSEIASHRAFNYMVRTPRHVWWVHRGDKADLRPRQRSLSAEQLDRLGRPRRRAAGDPRPASRLFQDDPGQRGGRLSPPDAANGRRGRRKRSRAEREALRAISQGPGQREVRNGDRENAKGRKRENNSQKLYEQFRKGQGNGK